MEGLNSKLTLGLYEAFSKDSKGTSTGWGL